MRLFFYFNYQIYTMSPAVFHANVISVTLVWFITMNTTLMVLMIFSCAQH